MSDGRSDGSSAPGATDRPRRTFASRLRYIEPVHLATAMVLIVIVAGVVVALSIFGLPEPADPWATLPDNPSVVVNLAGYFPAQGDEPLAKPLGIAIVGSRVCIAESDAARVSIFDVQGRRRGAIELDVAEAASVAVPTVVAPAGSRRLAIVDAAGARVLVYAMPWLWFEPRLALTIGEADPVTAPVRPTAVAFADGEYYVADAESASIKVFDDGGAFLREIAADLDPRLGYVGGMAVSGERLVLAESGSDRVVSLDRETGADLMIFPDAYGLPRGICAVEGGVSVTAVLGGAIYVCDEKGSQTHTIDAASVADWPPSGPEGVAWYGSKDRLYVTEPDFGRVVVFNVRM